jgi:GNAT superfamily N-acetyltransferase
VSKKPNYKVAPLGEHDRAAFSCGKTSLDTYLHTQVNQDQRKGLARAFVITEEQAPRHIIGYFTLSTLSVDAGAAPEDLVKSVPYPEIPCLLIGRLALDTKEQGKGLGVRLLVAAFEQALRVSDSVGFRAILVDALDDEAEGFYLKFGFRKLPGVQRRLFVSVKEARASLQVVKL